MKKHYLSLVFVILVFSSAMSQSADLIDNKKLIELTNAKLGDDLIINLIKTSQTSFECGLSAILALKKENVGERVIAEMMKKCNSEKNSQLDEANNSNPNYPHSSGIYIYDKSKLSKLYSTTVTQEKSGGFGSALASRLSYGLAKSSIKAAIDGAASNTKCTDNAVFYFYFDASNNSNLGNWWFSKATSPNEFALIKLDAKSKVREFKKGKSDSFTQQTGIDEDQKVSFSFEEVKPNIFKVITKEKLKEGEYCFIYSATVPSQHSNDKVFDFSVAK